MKKLFIISSLLAAITASSAVAKTEGNYVGVDLVRTSSNHKYTVDNRRVVNSAKFEDVSTGFGLNYKHAFNFGGMFVAPGAFYENNNNKAHDSNYDTTKLNNRYGLKFDIGYDITDDFAAYVTNGVSRLDYTVQWDSINRKKSYKQNDYFYGVGLAYKVAKNILVNLEYNNQKTRLKVPGGTSTIDASQTDIDVLKLGLAYNF